MSFFFAAINIGFLFFITYQVWKKDNSGMRGYYWPALFLKALAGICLGLVYLFYYDTGDTFTYFSEGSLLANVARSEFVQYIRFLWSSDASAGIWDNVQVLQSRALFMAKVTSLVNLVSHDNYWITSLYFSLISFLSAWMLVKALIRFNPALRLPAVVAFLFFPSVVFWSAGLIKESLAMASLYFLTTVFLKVWSKEALRRWEWIMIPVSIWIVWKLKYYFLIVFLPVLIASLVVGCFYKRWHNPPSNWYRALLWCVVFLTPIVIASSLVPNFYPHRFLDVIVSNYEEFQSISNPDDLIYYDSLQATVSSVFRNAPWALFSGLFRKMPWEAGTLFQLCSGLENGVLLLLSCLAVANIPRMMRAQNSMLLFSVLLYCIVLCVFLGLSTPNFGTLSRYRVGFLPFYCFLISIENPLYTWIRRRTQRSADHLVP